MNSERLDKAIAEITDRNWTITSVFRDSEASLRPEYVTPREAAIIRVIGRIVPEKHMPAVVRQWAGEQGEAKFVESMNSGKE